MNTQENTNEVSRETAAPRRTNASPLAGMKLADMAKIGIIAQAILPQAEPLLAKIREDAERVTNAVNAAGQAGTDRSSLWTDTLAVAELVYNATTETPSLRGIIYSEVMAEFLGSQERNTAKAYASTAKNVLATLWTEQGKTPAEVKKASYAEVRTMLRPVGNPQADADMESIRKMLAEIRRFGDKFAKGTEEAPENSATRLARIRAVVEPEYNAVKSERDKASAAAKAARELKELQQKAPREAGTVETVAAKPEALPQEPLRRVG